MYFCIVGCTLIRKRGVNECTVHGPLPPPPVKFHAERGVVGVASVPYTAKNENRVKVMNFKENKKEINYDWWFGWGFGWGLGVIVTSILGILLYLGR